MIQKFNSSLLSTMRDFNSNFFLTNLRNKPSYKAILLIFKITYRLHVMMPMLLSIVLRYVNHK